MTIDKNQWSSWIIALGVEIAKDKEEQEVKFHAETIKFGMDKLIKEIEEDKL